MEIIRMYRYIKCSREICFLKILSSCCGHSPTSPFYLLLCEHKRYDNAATIWNSEKAKSRIMTSLRGRVDTGQKKISPELDAFGLWDSIMLRSVLTWQAFWNLSTVYSFNFLKFSGRSKLRICGSVCISLVGSVFPSVRPSICPRGTAELSPDRTSWWLIFVYGSIKRWQSWSYIKT